MQTSLESCVEMFERMKSGGWDMGQPMLWGFFFCDADDSKLLEVFSELQGSNYKLESIRKLEDSESLKMLHASKIDILTPEKLYKRNVAFNELAAYCGVDYDGWDVGLL